MKRKLFILLSVLIIIGVLVTIWITTGGKNMFIKNTYQAEVAAELADTTFSAEVFTEDDIKDLPAPVQRYFRYCGYLGKTKMANAKIVFKDVDFKQGDKELKMDSEQVNFVNDPARIVYMNSKLMGFIPFEGRDKYQKGKGAMTGKLMKVITLFDETGDQMNQAALATFMAEVLMVPTCVLQDYITWEEIDSNQAKVKMEYGGYQAEGVFFFNDRGEALRFETYDRFMDQGDGTFKREKWAAKMSDYETRDGIKVPTRIRGIWELEEGDLVYFDGNIIGLEYNVNDI